MPGRPKWWQICQGFATVKFPKCLLAMVLRCHDTQGYDTPLGRRWSCLFLSTGTSWRAAGDRLKRKSFGSDGCINCDSQASQDIRRVLMEWARGTLNMFPVRRGVSPTTAAVWSMRAHRGSRPRLQASPRRLCTLVCQAGRAAQTLHRRSCEHLESASSDGPR